MAKTDITAFTCGGELVVDSRLIAERLGVEHESFVETIRKYESFAARTLGEFNKKRENPEGGIGRPSSYFLLNEKQASFLLSKTRYGLSQKSVNLFLQEGFDFSAFVGHSDFKSRKKESEYSNELARQLNGQREVRTLAGNIDVLTEWEVIEVKQVKQWKCALGQVLVYGAYYPKRRKRVHLYGKASKKYLQIIRKHCSKLKVAVVWEA